MAWTAPLTWTPQSALTAAQLNIHLRDNMLETEAAKATGAGGYFVATNPNAIAERQQGKSEVTTSQTTTNSSYVNLATTGPTVTLTVGVQALVIWSCQYQSSVANTIPLISIALSGANPIAADDSYALTSKTGQSNYPRQHMHHLWFTGLTPGPTTFQMKYRMAGGGTGTFARRRMVVLPY